MNAIETRDLTKRYNNLIAVDKLNLAIPVGSVYGFIGPNGAGKTTTLRMLAGLLQPTSGEILLNGESIAKDAHRARWLVGYMPDFFGVYDDMKAWEYLDFFARCYDVPAKRRASVITELLELVDLSEKRDAFVESLSRGMRQRLCLAHALVHDPKVLLLDEPASGLDPRADKLLHIRLLNPDDATLESATAALKAYPGVIDVFDATGGVEVAFSGDDAATSGLLRHLIQQEIPILSFAEAASDLEDIFLTVTKGEVQ